MLDQQHQDLIVREFAAAASMVVESVQFMCSGMKDNHRKMCEQMAADHEEHLSLIRSEMPVSPGYGGTD